MRIMNHDVAGPLAILFRNYTVSSFAGESFGGVLCPELMTHCCCMLLREFLGVGRAALPLQDSANGAIKFDHKGKQAPELTSYLCKEVLVIDQLTINIANFKWLSGFAPFA